LVKLKHLKVPLVCEGSTAQPVGMSDRRSVRVRAATGATVVTVCPLKSVTGALAVGLEDEHPATKPATNPPMSSRRAITGSPHKDVGGSYGAEPPVVCMTTGRSRVRHEAEGRTTGVLVVHSRSADIPRSRRSGACIASTFGTDCERRKVITRPSRVWPRATPVAAPRLAEHSRR
jgi:hypothetical protein